LGSSGRQKESALLSCPIEALCSACESEEDGGGVGPDGGCGCAGSSATVNTWTAALHDDVGEVERLVGQDPSLLNARTSNGWTALMFASAKGHVGVVRRLLDKGAALDEREGVCGCTALCLASCSDRTPVVRLVLEGGGDPTTADHEGVTPLMAASSRGYLG
jgi:ankyrin repeat protein